MIWLWIYNIPDLHNHKIHKVANQTYNVFNLGIAIFLISLHFHPKNRHAKGDWYTPKISELEAVKEAELPHKFCIKITIALP